MHAPKDLEDPDQRVLAGGHRGHYRAGRDEARAGSKVVFGSEMS